MDPSDVRDPCLAEIAEQLERTGWAAQLLDSQWRLVWASRELKTLIGASDDSSLGYGVHMAEAFVKGGWADTMPQRSAVRWMGELLPRMSADMPGGEAAVRALLSPEIASALEPANDAEPGDLWASHIDFLQGDLPPARVNYVAARARDDSGKVVGIVLMYGSSLPASVLALVARGNQGMFERMMRLIEPGRRRAAILFADIQASGVLSRRLSSAAYFKVIRAATTAIDQVVVHNLGIVGKHVGDGVTAFFLADDLGSASGAARAALDAARSMPAAAYRAVVELGEELGPVDLRDSALNVGVHYSGALYMGQVVTGGRLEVTALGDEVNECARIQEPARDGAVLASKDVVERLEDPDAEALGIDPDRMSYRTVAELEHATDKAVRDAGGIAVTTVGSGSPRAVTAR